MTTELIHPTFPSTDLARIGERSACVRETLALLGSGSVVLPPHCREPGALAAILLTGLELGLQPMEAVRSLYLVSGRVVLAADQQLALVVRRGVRPTWVETSATAATLRLERHGFEAFALTYTIADAQRAGLASRDVWRSHPGAMLRARATTSAIRAYCPDLLSGVYSPDEASQLRGYDGPAPGIDGGPDPRDELREELIELAEDVGGAALRATTEAAATAAQTLAWYRRQLDRMRARLTAPPTPPAPSQPPASETPPNPEPTDGHHADWALGQRRFFADLGALGLGKDEVWAVCVDGWGEGRKPSQLAGAELGQFYRWLKSEAGSAEIARHRAAVGGGS